MREWAYNVSTARLLRDGKPVAELVGSFGHYQERVDTVQFLLDACNEKEQRETARKVDRELAALFADGIPAEGHPSAPL